MTSLMATGVATAATQVLSLGAARGVLTQVLAQVVAAILVVCLTLAVGFLLVAYTEASARRLRGPRVVTKDRRPNDGVSPLLTPLLLLGLLLAVSMLMGISF